MSKKIPNSSEQNAQNLPEQDDYSYDTEDSVNNDIPGQVQPTQDNNEYGNADGKFDKTSYVSDENGFGQSGSDLPVPPNESK